MKRKITAAAFMLCTIMMKAQTPVDIAENTVKVSGLGEEVFYYGFADGDQLIFSFEEMNGKELKEIEIIEPSSSSKFMDYKTKKIENKSINISMTGIYKFRLANSALTGRICKIKIQRIPASEATKHFNCSVYWKTVYDTTYTTEQEKYIARTDTGIVHLTDQVAKVHSQTNLNGATNTFNFNLPPHTVSWSYYIGVDQAGRKAYETATEKLSGSSLVMKTLANYNPMAALALGGTSFLSAMQGAEDIDFYIVSGSENARLFAVGQAFSCIKKGKVINDFSRMTSHGAGSYFVCLSNDNAIMSVSVIIKITAITVTHEWALRPVLKMAVSEHQEGYLKN